MSWESGRHEVSLKRGHDRDVAATTRSVDEEETSPSARKYSVRAAWMGLGLALRLDANAYVLLGIPLTLAFTLARPLKFALYDLGTGIRFGGFL